MKMIGPKIRVLRKKKMKMTNLKPHNLRVIIEGQEPLLTASEETKKIAKLATVGVRCCVILEQIFTAVHVGVGVVELQEQTGSASVSVTGAVPCPSTWPTSARKKSRSTGLNHHPIAPPQH
uniref:Uncharacterized protein n=1 Tax=Pristionchus pacificus TaxID=54126 RepID=A0A2A6BCT9_PRIPA|eukprot:PDM63651.1 hypothetical protein PRIPAC_49624 [Pristionchus pacificus]